jgi:hypothetical protein
MTINLGNVKLNITLQTVKNTKNQWISTITNKTLEAEDKCI